MTGPLIVAEAPFGSSERTVDRTVSRPLRDAKISQRSAAGCDLEGTPSRDPSVRVLSGAGSRSAAPQ